MPAPPPPLNETLFTYHIAIPNLLFVWFKLCFYKQGLFTHPHSPTHLPFLPSPSPLHTHTHTHTHVRWYHGAITRAEAEAILAHKLDFSFLVRNSESCRTDYSLSIRSVSSHMCMCTGLIFVCSTIMAWRLLTHSLGNTRILQERAI